MTSAHVYLDHDRPDPLDLVCDRELLRTVCSRVLPGAQGQRRLQLCAGRVDDRCVLFGSCLDCLGRPRRTHELCGGASGNPCRCMGTRALRLRDDAPQSGLAHVRFHLHDRHLRIHLLSGHAAVRHLAEDDLSAIVLARHVGRRHRGECMGCAGVALGVRRGGGALGLHAVFAARPIHGRRSRQPRACGVLWN